MCRCVIECWPIANLDIEDDLLPSNLEDMGSNFANVDKLLAPVNQIDPIVVSNVLEQVTKIVG